MADSTERHHNPFGEAIPEEARTHANSAHEEIRKAFEAMFPAGVGEHGRQARRETLPAFHSILDESIQRMDEKKKS
jgi:CRISPR/Cas system CSM-associated protein Csm2 small subunit